MDSRTPEGHSSRLKSCALFALVPVLLLVALVTIFIINNRPVSISVPTPKMPKDNGYDYFVRAGNMIVGTGPMSHPTRKPSSWTVPELRKFAHENKACLTVLRQGLTRPYMAKPSRSFGDDFPEYARFRELARVLVGESMSYQAVGDYRRAVDSRLDCIEFGVTIPRGGNLIPALVGSATEAIGGSGLDAILPRLNAMELDHAAKRLEGIQAKRVQFADAIDEEGDFLAAAVAEEMRSGTIWATSPNPALWFVLGPAGSSSSPQDILCNLRYALGNKRSMLKSTVDYCSALAAEDRSQPYGLKSRIPMPRNAMAQSVICDLTRARCGVEKYAAITALMQTEVALRRYRLDHGSYPAILAPLVPTYLRGVPIDPLGMGKSLKYKPMNGGKSFLLYSLGPNLKDDGGKPGSYQDDFATGDVVAGQF